jgi:hypothetical protein
VANDYLIIYALYRRGAYQGARPLVANQLILVTVTREDNINILLG